MHLTNLEQQVINNIKNVDSPGYFFTTCIQGNIPGNVFRGVLSSLIKKGVLDVDYESGTTKDNGLVSVIDTEVRKQFPDNFFQ